MVEGILKGLLGALFLWKEDSLKKSLLFIFYFTVGISVYWIGLSGGFVFDDYPNLVGNSFISRTDWGWHEFWLAVWSGEAGPTGRPIAMATFALDSMLWGLDPSIMKFENILIHCLTGYVFFLLAGRICVKARLSAKAAFWLPALVALMWLVHPLNLTGVLYIVQRMASLSALFAALALLMYMYWRDFLDQDCFSFRHFFGFISFSIASMLSKENGFLIIFYIAILELILFNEYKANLKLKVFQSFLLFASFCAASLVIANLFLEFFSFTDSYSSREFTVDQRLMTEFRVLMSYLSQALFPTISSMSLYHDDIRLSESIFDPVSTGISFIFITALLLLSLFFKARLKVFSLCVLMFLSSQLMETFTFGLEIKYEHRMYFSSFWVFFLLAFVILKLVQHSERSTLSCALGLCVALIISFAAYQTVLRSVAWSSPMKLAIIEARQNPGSFRANVQAGSVFASRATREGVSKLDAVRHYNAGQRYFNKAMSLKPGSASACLAGLILESRHHERVPLESTINRCNEALMGHIDASTVTSLQLLVKCQKNDDCVRDDYTLQLLDTAFDSAGNNVRYQALVLAEIGSFYKYLKEQHDVAIDLYKRAEEMHGDNQLIRYELIHMLIDDSRYVEARTIAEKLRETDKWGRFQDIYEALNID